MAARKFTDGQLNRVSLRDLFARMVVMPNDESAMILLLRLWAIFGHLERALDVPAIAWYRFEYGVRGGRVDLLLFHKDGGATIVEVKGQSDTRNIVGGIGQLCMYATTLTASLDRIHRPRYIRRVLCAPVPPADCMDLIAACEMAGVTFRPLPRFRQFREHVDSLLAADVESLA